MNERPHKKLIAWQKAMELVTRVYTQTRDFPREEEFGLKAQLRRAAVSVPSNIAEGLTRKTKNDKVHFLNIAQASLSETDTQVEIALRLGMMTSTDYSATEENLMNVQMLVSGLTRRIMN